MRNTKLWYLLTTAVFAASTAHADIVLLANDPIVVGTNADRSALGGNLENGMPANIFGGLGSGLAYAGGTTFLAVPDRGPNATAYNPAVNDTVSYISRFHTLTLVLAPSAPGAALPFALTPTLDATTLLSSPTPLVYGAGPAVGLGSGAPSQNTPSRFYFAGRSDNFDPSRNSLNAGNGRLDPESVLVSNDGRSIFISDEYGPYVYQFDRATGQRIRAFALPEHFAIANLAPTEAAEIGGNTVGRTTNKGMEGLAITPDGTMLVGIMQAAFLQDAAVDPTKKVVHIVTIDIATGATRQYAYRLTTGSGVSEIVAINNHQFLVDERDGKGLGDGSAAVVKQFFIIDLTGATEVTGLTGEALAAAAVQKTLFVDLVALLGQHGIAADQVPAKIEGLAFGPDATLGGTTYHTLYVANDNDFLPDVAGPSRFFVLGFTDGDLPGLVPQRLAP